MCVPETLSGLGAGGQQNKLPVEFKAYLGGRFKFPIINVVALS